jgi:hypothetical protein
MSIGQDTFLEAVRRAQSTGESLNWIVPKKAEEGDKAVLFFRSIAVVAFARIAGTPTPAQFRSRNAYSADVDEIRSSPYRWRPWLALCPNGDGRPTLEASPPSTYHSRASSLRCSNESKCKRRPAAPRGTVVCGMHNLHPILSSAPRAHGGVLSRNR